MLLDLGMKTGKQVASPTRSKVRVRVRVRVMIRVRVVVDDWY